VGAATESIKPNRRRDGGARVFAVPDSFLWLPSHMGRLPVRLQAQNHACSARSAFHSTGENAVPLCEPSQNGWLFERPQAHHQ
jgi:hypothetical protein